MSINSDWIFDSWEPSTEETSTNPLPDLLDELADGEIYMKYIWTYQRHIIVQSPNNFTSVFNQLGTRESISSGSGNRYFAPIAKHQDTDYGQGPVWRCTRERLTVENAGDGTFRLEQDFTVESKWKVVNRLSDVTEVDPVPTLSPDPYLGDGSEIFIA